MPSNHRSHPNQQPTHHPKIPLVTPHDSQPFIHPLRNPLHYPSRSAGIARRLRTSKIIAAISIHRIRHERPPRVAPAQDRTLRIQRLDGDPRVVTIGAKRCLEAGLVRLTQHVLNTALLRTAVKLPRLHLRRAVPRNENRRRGAGVAGERVQSRLGLGGGGPVERPGTVVHDWVGAPGGKEERGAVGGVLRQRVDVAPAVEEVAVGQHLRVALAARQDATRLWRRRDARLHRRFASGVVERDDHGRGFRRCVVEAVGGVVVERERRVSLILGDKASVMLVGEVEVGAVEVGVLAACAESPDDAAVGGVDVVE